MISRLAIVTAAALLAGGCSTFGNGQTGNPYNEPYAGSPGSAYPADVNPPATLGMVTYDPSIPAPVSSDMTMPGLPSTPATVMPSR